MEAQVIIRRFLFFILLTSLVISIQAQSWVDKMKNRNDSLSTLREKANNGDCESMMKMYKITFERSYLIKAINHGYIPAIVEGGNVEQLRKAAKTGNHDAIFALGKKLFERKKDHNNKESRLLLEQVKDTHPYGAYLIGEMYRCGWGEPVDSCKAWTYYQFAADHGVKEAKQIAFELKSICAEVQLAASFNPIDSDIPQTRLSNNSTFVVIIGNGKYPNGIRIDYAEHDGSIFKAYCIKTLGVPNKNIRMIENASYNDMKNALSWISQILEVFEGEGKAIFYFAGLGAVDENKSLPYLMPVDAEFQNTSLMLSIEYLYKMLNAHTSKGIVILIDASFNGTLRDGKSLSSARGIAVKSRLAQTAGKTVTFYAAQQDQTAFGFPKMQHGIFTQTLLKALYETKGELNLGQLFNRLKKEVNITSLKEFNMPQNPEIQIGSNSFEWQKWTLW